MVHKAMSKKPKYVERIDNDDKGELDDIAVSHVSMFRMEQMDDGCWWIRLYRDQKGKDDLVFWLNSKSKITGIVERD
jgi:hypothetical protein